ncbi:MAG: hypothetical protein SGPRY_013988, partial [Prymnesium sp.]
FAAKCRMSIIVNVQNEIQEVEVQIQKVEEDIAKVEERIDQVEEDIEKATADKQRAELCDEKKQLRDEKKQLRDEKKQLRDEKNKLLDEENKLLDEQKLLLEQSAGGSQVARSPFCSRRASPLLPPPLLTLSDGSVRPWFCPTCPCLWETYTHTHNTPVLSPLIGFCISAILSHHAALG